MTKKCKTILFEITIILTVVVISAFITNELRADKLPLLPYYVMERFYHEMSLADFLQKEAANFSGFIFDARPHALYEKKHISGAKSFPAAEFDFFYPFYLTNAPPGAPIFIYGRTLTNAYDLELAYRLSLRGYSNITVLF